MNKEGFLILLELCTVYFALQYAAVLDPAAGFQGRRQLVVTDGGGLGYKRFFNFAGAPQTFSTPKVYVFYFRDKV